MFAILETDDVVEIYFWFKRIIKDITNNFM
jgi:hypothetical protein